MKPFHIFGLGVCLVAVFFLISLFFPANGLKIMGYTLYFPNRWWHTEETIPYKNVNEIIASVSIDEDADTLNMANDSLATDSTKKVASKIALSDSLAFRHSFELPDGQDTLMYPFFRRMQTAGKLSKPIRILHYSDSQIESDRITATIRNYMQKKFGGRGCGFIPVVPASDLSRSFQGDVPDKWQRFSMHDRKKDSLSSNRYGIAGAFSRYVATDAADTVSHIGLTEVAFGYRLARSFTHVRFYYENTNRPVSVVVNYADTQMLKAGKDVSSALWRFAMPQRSFFLDLASNPLPDVYGITLDGASGVAVDNLPLRGSTGIEFTQMDSNQLQKMFAMMDVGAVIYQFGANVVTMYGGKSDTYARLMAQQLKTLKAISPHLLIVVVGVGDMSQNSPNGYVTYPGLNEIREVQRKTALECGCVFWDLYDAMGGENSMPAWVLADPPLANKDFIHFTITGAKVIGELFCQAWEAEYTNFFVLSQKQEAR
ncbi:MAG: GDSL-type esterase/lipase family protein [Bacteroidales bacterium]|nr:GDSL-type esterase/lipase family protein [Bacteroidales bacterium]